MCRQFIPTWRVILSALPINYRNRTRIGRVYNYIDQSRAYEHLRPSVSHIIRGKSKCLCDTATDFCLKRKAFVQSIVENRRVSPYAHIASEDFLRKSSVFAKSQHSGRDIRRLRTRVIEIFTCKKKSFVVRFSL